MNHMDGGWVIVERENIEVVTDVHQSGHIFINERDVVVLQREKFGQMSSYCACTSNDNFHNLL